MYDSRGRLVVETLAITGVGSYTTRWTYNSADQLASMTYPNGEIIYPIYNPQGWVTEVGSEFWVSYAMQAKYDEAGRLLGWTLGNGVKTSNTYKPWNEQGGRLESTSSLTSQTPAVTRQHLAYSYDANGNISAIQDTVASETLNYSYDVLDRLTGVSGAYSQSYGYNAATGNLASKAGQTLVYTDTNHPHAATGMGSSAYAYDANGNMVSRQIASVTYTLSYDAESRLAGILGGGMSASYTYNGDGKRVKAVVSTGSDIKTTAYIGDYFEVSVGDPKPVTAPTPVDCSITICLYLPLVIASAPQIPAGHAWTSYYTAGGSRVAMRVKSNQDSLEDGVYYFLSDHLGSTAITLDPTGNLVSELRYSAWGETRYTNGTTPTQRRYTGQLEAEAGLYFYNARWYDSALGRFAQADSIIPQPGIPLSWDRYIYTKNNPLNYNDPTGHIQACDENCRIITNGEIASAFGVTLTGFSKKEENQILAGVAIVAVRLAEFSFNSATSTFRKAFGQMQFIEDGKNLGSYYGIAENGKIRLKTGLVTSRLVTHELGHSFDAHYHMYSGGLFSNSHPITLLGNYPINDIEGNFITGFNQNKGRFDRYGDNIAPYNGFISDDYTTEWQWHPLQMDSDGASTTEAFADIFMNWVYNTFSKTPAGLALNNWIITNMSDWINFR